jgi:hypothetical protein
MVEGQGLRVDGQGIREWGLETRVGDGRLAGEGAAGDVKE